jgi:ABC-type polysaccharide/polyol phosphate export permease
VLIKNTLNLYKSRDLIWNLTLRELKGKYRKSFLGWTWSLLNPLALMGTYWFVFGYIFGNQAPLGDPSGIQNFPLFLLCGLLPWGFFGLVTSLGLTSMVGNAGLIKKVAFAKETLVVSQAIFSLVQHSIEMSLLIVVLLAIGSPLILQIPITLVLIILLSIFATGIAFALAMLAVYFRDLMYLWTIVIQIYFFATPIIYDAESISNRVSDPIVKILEWQPMAVFVSSFRSALYSGHFPGWKQLTYLLIVSFASFAVGITIFSKLGRRVAEEI